MFCFSSDSANFQSIYKHYSTQFSREYAEYEGGAASLVLPIIPGQILVSLCKTVSYHFQREPALLRLDIDCVVVGDLHGHILDLFRVLKKFGPPPARNYVFLGDVIDRGEFSLETLSLVFVMKALFPQNVFMIRGNHEFPELCLNCGFGEELKSLYEAEAVGRSFFECFSNMPIAALLYSKVLCVHGGIGPSTTSLADLATVARPLVDYNKEPAMSVLWSDPSEKIRSFAPSLRGSGFYYGEEAFHKFLVDNSLDLVVRGHECVHEGINMMFQRRLVTLFSASNYCGVSPNKSAVLSVNSNGMKKEATVFLPIKFIPRSRAIFLRSEKESTFVISRSLLESIHAKTNLPHLSLVNEHKNSSLCKVAPKLFDDDCVRKEGRIAVERRAYTDSLLSRNVLDKPCFVNREKTVRKLNARRGPLR